MDPLASNGSGRMTLIGPETYEQNTECDAPTITKLPGAPDRAQPVGTSFETIHGTGQWTYTGGSLLGICPK